MKTNYCHIRKLFSWGLLVVFLFPSAVQFEHFFDSHKHETCTNVSVHIHEKKWDCSIYDFHFSSFDFQFFTHTIQPDTALIRSFTTEAKLPHIEEPPLGFDLRGPPTIS